MAADRRTPPPFLRVAFGARARSDPPGPGLDLKVRSQSSRPTCSTGRVPHRLLPPSIILLQLHHRLRKRLRCPARPRLSLGSSWHRGRLSGGSCHVCRFAPGMFDAREDADLLADVGDVAPG